MTLPVLHLNIPLVLEPLVSNYFMYFTNAGMTTHFNIEYFLTDKLTVFHKTNQVMINLYHRSTPPESNFQTGK